MSKTILVVDDEKRLVSLVESYLTQEGYRVVTAHNGKDALTVADHENPDLIVTHLSCLLDARVGEGQAAVADHLFDVSANRLLVFLGYVAARNPRTRFIVYSRSVFQTHGGEQEWTASQVARLPILRDRLSAFIVPGGPQAASFRDPETRQLLRARVAAVLGLGLQ